MIRGGRDGQHVTGGADGEPEGASWPRPADTAGRDRLAQRPRVRPGTACHLLPEYFSRSAPGLPRPQPGQARHAHRRPSAGRGGLHLRADLRQLGSPVIVILRSHPASLHGTRNGFTPMPQAGSSRLGSCSARTRAAYRAPALSGPSRAMVRACSGRICPAGRGASGRPGAHPDRSDNRSRELAAGNVAFSDGRSPRERAHCGRSARR